MNDNPYFAYLTGSCPQFESGAVLVPRLGDPLILGGPESEPFAKLDSAITRTRNFPVFMVPDEEYPNATIISFPELFAELNSMLGQVRRVGLVGGGRMPAECYKIISGFSDVELGARIETGYEITEIGAVPFSQIMEQTLLSR
ncbi:MAG: hypothetical protein M1133_09430 [Armatimonadetes bacterium]|nr:hypothetical protein [Armatimonadota bacterium]